jgi:ribosomal protein S18 acetylase RimI-like enzyme
MAFQAAGRRRPVIIVRRATERDVDLVAPLFDAYRQFYDQAADINRARSFLSERLAREESIVLVAVKADSVVGFTQLYPSFSSTSAARTCILNDLYVAPEHRRSGVARLLLNEAARFARTVGAIELSLSTAHSNTAAQKLYESLGWVLDEKYRSYCLPVGA